jgi:hypothetical protein
MSSQADLMKEALTNLLRLPRELRHQILYEIHDPQQYIQDTYELEKRITGMMADLLPAVIDGSVSIQILIIDFWVSELRTYHPGLSEDIDYVASLWRRPVE